MHLSSLAGQFTLEELASVPLEPSVTPWHYRHARRHMSVWGAGRPAPHIPITRERVPCAVWEAAVEFMYHPANLQQVAFGEKNLHIEATGETFLISKTLRRSLKESLWREYRDAHTYPDRTYDGLERSAFLQLCSEATGGHQKALGALDNIAVRYGTENWKEVDAVAGELGTILRLSDDAKKQLHSLSDKVQTHIKYDLRRHLLQSSRCSRHCFTHLLSDAHDEQQQGVCPPSCGSHDGHCKECDMADTLFAILRAYAHQIVEQGLVTQKVAEIMEYRINKCAQNYAVYLRHEIRGYWESQIRPNCVASLAQHQVVIVCDWKMKFLMTVLRESMVDYFGKAGIPWHGFMFISREEDQVQMEYAHFITDDRKEDAFSVISSAHAELTLYRERHPEKTEGLLFTDGAKCYSGKYLCLALVEVSKWTGLRITDFHIGEAGKNKTELDGAFATEGSGVNRVVAQGNNDVRVAADLVRNLELNKFKSGKDANSIALAFKPDRTAMASVKAQALARISKVSHRRYEWNESGKFVGLTLRNQSLIGAGKRHNAAEVERMWEKGTPQPPTGVVTVDATGVVRKFPGPPNSGAPSNNPLPTVREATVLHGIAPSDPPSNMSSSTYDAPSTSTLGKSRRRVPGGGGI